MRLQAAQSGLGAGFNDRRMSFRGQGIEDPRARLRLVLDNQQPHAPPPAVIPSLINAVGQHRAAERLQIPNLRGGRLSVRVGPPSAATP